MEIFGAHFGQSTGCLGNLWCNLCNKLCFGVYEAGNGHGIRFHKVDPMFGEWAAYDCSVLGLLKTVPICMNWTKTINLLCA